MFQLVREEHVKAFREWVLGLGDLLPVVPGLLASLFQRVPAWPPPGKSALMNPVSNEVRDRFEPLQPLIGLVSPPHYFSETEPVFVLYLMHQAPEGPGIPVASVHFMDGRRMLEVCRLLLDTGGERTCYEPASSVLVNDEATPTTRRLIEHLLRTFPQLSEVGERCRASALKDLFANAPA